MTFRLVPATTWLKIDLTNDLAWKERRISIPTLLSPARCNGCDAVAEGYRDRAFKKGALRQPLSTGAEHPEASSTETAHIHNDEQSH